MSGLLIVSYPPDYDGELHIKVEENVGFAKSDKSFTYTFTHAAQGDSWETLVKAAQAIIDQDSRQRGFRDRTDEIRKAARNI